MIHNFKADRPYKIVEVEHYGIKYKITQPFKWWFFGLDKSDYFDVKMKKAYNHDEIVYFDSKKDVDEFIETEIKKYNRKDVVVFDSEKQ